MSARLSLMALVMGFVASMAIGQTVEIASTLKEGDSARYTVARMISVTQEPKGGEASTRSMSHLADVTLTVNSISDAGVRTIGMTFDSLVISMEAGADEIVFRHLPNPVDPDGEPITRFTNDAIEALGNVLFESKVTYKVSAEGEVTGVSGLEKFEQAAAAEESFNAREVVGFFTTASLPGMVQPLYTGDGATRASRAVGRGWEHVETVALPPVAAIDIMTDWRVESVLGDVAVMKGEIGFEARLPPNPAADVARLGIREGTGTTQMNWDVGRDQLMSRISTQELATVWTLNDLELVQKQSSRIMLVRTQ